MLKVIEEQSLEINCLKAAVEYDYNQDTFYKMKFKIEMLEKSLRKYEA